MSSHPLAHMAKVARQRLAAKGQRHQIGISAQHAMGAHEAAARVGADALGVEVVKAIPEPIFGCHHRRVIIAQVSGHRLDGFRQVVKEIRAVVHVVRRHLVAPLGPVHHHAVGHGIVARCSYRPCAQRVRPWSWDRAGGDPCRRVGAAVGIHDVHFHAAISGRIHRLFQQGASLGQLVLGRWRWLNAEALVNGRVWIIGRRDRPFRRQRLGVLRQQLTKHERSKDHAVHAACLPSVENAFVIVHDPFEVPLYIHPKFHTLVLSPKDVSSLSCR